MLYSEILRRLWSENFTTEGDKTRPRLSSIGLTLSVIIASPIPAVDEAGEIKRENVGPTKIDGRVVVPTNQVLTPAGTQILFPGRPADVALSPDRRLLAVLSHKEVLTIRIDSGEIAGRVRISGASYKGILF